MAERVYLDWNATAPLRIEARDAMIAAMDVVGNPSSVHAEGRTAKGIVERARAQVAAAFGADGADVIFTSGATEAAALARGGLYPDGLMAAEIEHDCVCENASSVLDYVDRRGLLNLPMSQVSRGVAKGVGIAVQAANSETGICQPMDRLGPELQSYAVPVLCDAVQTFGKVPIAFNWLGVESALLSAHKFGGPKGVGALVIRRGTELSAQIRGGGQEMGRRSGTENVVGIAGFGAAAEAAVRDLEADIWAKVEKLRTILEKGIAAASNQTIFVGNNVARLPNTSCFITPGWKGETQVMAMDLAGFAISAGSACSSGKVRESRVLRAMGFTPEEARSAVRVSLGPMTTETEIKRFVDAWGTAFAKFRARAA